MATLAFIEIKFITSCILSMTSPSKFCHMTQIILWTWSYDQSNSSICIREVIITSIL